MATSPPHLDLTIATEDLEAGAAAVLSHVRPHWRAGDVTYKLFTDGITNKLVGCFNVSDVSSGSDMILVRVYGPSTDLLIDRGAEINNIKLLQAVGFAPPLYATFNNGMAYQYIPGVVLTVDTVCSKEVYPHIARRLARLHKLRLHDSTQTKDPALWLILDKFLNLVPQQYSNPHNQQRYVSLVAGGIERLRRDCSQLRSELNSLGSPVVFCHNDLLLANIVYQPESSSISFIDFEYAAYNYQAFDIGNHFDEFAGVSDVDFSRYPGEQLQKDWLQIYLTEYMGHEPSQAQVTTLYDQVSRFALAAHFFWGIWALVQAQYSNIDFDFMEYAGLRLNEYFKRKEMPVETGMPR